MAHAPAPRRAEAPRRRGRPRSELRSEQVLAAARAEIAEHGISGATVERIAARAGVSKVTIYRRWPERITLVLAALESLPVLHAPDTGSLIGDLRTLRTELLAIVDEHGLGEVLPALIAERRRTAHESAIRAYIEQRQAPFAHVVQRAIERGEVRTTMSLELVTLLVSSPLAMSIMNRDAPLDDAEWIDIVTTVVRGLNAAGGTP